MSAQMKEVIGKLFELAEHFDELGISQQIPIVDKEKGLKETIKADMLLYPPNSG